MLTELGVDPQRTLTDPDGFHIRTEDGLRFWIFAESDSVLLGRGYDPGAYDHVTRSGVSLLCYLLLIGFLMLYVISKYLDRRVLQGIFDINDKLQTITAGNLTERVDVRSTPEFGALSDRINQMVVRLLDDQALMSTALEAARLPMGFYEYNRSQRRVQLLGRMEELLELEPGEEERLSDWTFLEERLAWLRRCPLEKEEDVYRVPAPEERYVRLESFVRGDYVYGVLADVTETVMEKQRIKQERDRDILTGLYSRRAFRTRAVKLLRDTDKLGRGALVVVDADNLKYINDTYGHEAGDRYLISVGGALRLGDMSHCLAARLGGDEFALMIYGCATQRGAGAYRGDQAPSGRAVHHLRRRDRGAGGLLHGRYSVPRGRPGLRHSGPARRRADVPG